MKTLKDPQMNFFKRLFGGKEEPTEQEKQEAAARDFDILKYDGVKAMKMGQWGHAIRCFRHALELSEDLEVRDYLSQSLIRTGELLAANDELAEAQPDNQSVFVRIAQVAYMMENYQAMGDACERAMLIDDSQAVVYLLYAQASQGQGDDANTVATTTQTPWLCSPVPLPCSPTMPRHTCFAARLCSPPGSSTRLRPMPNGLPAMSPRTRM